MKKTILPGQISLFIDDKPTPPVEDKRNCFSCLYFESHRCRNQWIGNRPCPDGMKFIEYTGSTVKQCILATVEIFQDGYMHCPVIECYAGCEHCYDRLLDDDFEFVRYERQNYERRPRRDDGEEQDAQSL